MRKFLSKFLTGWARKPKEAPIAGCPDKLHYWSVGLPGFGVTTYDVQDCCIRRRRVFGLPRESVISRDRRPSAADWERFHDVLDELRAWGWRDEYRGHFIDGHRWEFRCRISKRMVDTRGENAYPAWDNPHRTTSEANTFDRLTEELERLVSPMKSAIVEEINGFLEKYGSGNFPHANELLPLLRAGVLGAETLEDDHYSLIMRGIKDRAKAGSPKAETVSFTLEMQDLVERVVQNRDEPCRLWRFKAAKGCFWVYEMVNSGTIAGCISDHPETP